MYGHMRGTGVEPEARQKKIPGGTRTHNLRIRSPTRCPLRHRDKDDARFELATASFLRFPHKTGALPLS